MREASTFYFIDRLGLVSLFCDVIPSMKADIARGQRCILFCVNASSSAQWIIVNLLRYLKIEYHNFNFRLMDAKNEDGNLIWLNTVYFDLNKVFGRVLEEKSFKNSLASNGHGDRRFGHYLLRKPIVINMANKKSLGRSLFFIKMAQWAVRKGIGGEPPSTVVVFVATPSSLWSHVLQEYGHESDVSIREVRLRGTDLAWALRHNALGRWAKGIINSFHARVQQVGVIKRSTDRAALMVEYYGQLNLNNPQCYCDLFFYRPEILGEHKIILTFNLPGSPLDAGLMAQLATKGVEPLLLNPKATHIPNVNFYQAKGSFMHALSSVASQDMWTRERLNYEQAVAYWQGLFEKTGTKVYTSWYKYSEEHIAIAEAMKRCNGVATIYQRAFEEFGSVEFMVDTDIVFGFSPTHVHLEKQARSRIAYHVAVGYVGDHRFGLVKDVSVSVRQKLQGNGARKIMAYFDENSIADDRWYYGHGPTRANYAFLLEKVLQDEFFAVVLKPKVPSSLKARLGQVGDLLMQAIETGRCFVFDVGGMHGAYPPAVAAQCADIAVHGHLFAATAAVESALTGIPTLIMDKEGWKRSLFYRLNKGKVVFEDWPQLWESCESYWDDPKKAPGLGDWSEVIDGIDPFRDGKAAERMATYMKWLLEGFEQGLSREDVMAQACERFRNIWGKDKVHETR